MCATSVIQGYERPDLALALQEGPLATDNVAESPSSASPFPICTQVKMQCGSREEDPSSETC